MQITTCYNIAKAYFLLGIVVFTNSLSIAGTDFMAVNIDGQWHSDKKLIFNEQTGYSVELKKGEVISLSLLLTPKSIYQNIKIKNHLSKGIKLVSGKIEQNFKNIPKDQIINIDFQVQVIADGEQHIDIDVVTADATSFYQVKGFYISVNKSQQKIKPKPEVVNNPNGSNYIIYKSK